MDPLAGTPWSSPATVAGFAGGVPNRVLIDYVGRLRGNQRSFRVLDIGCGAGRNAVPLAELGAELVGLDLSMPMLEAARSRVIDSGLDRLQLLLARMDSLPVASAAFDLVVAHGIWNLATSDRMFRLAVREAARAARPDAGLFVFTFSRHTLPDAAQPVPGESLVFTQFSGQRQVFLTEDQLLKELADAGFEPDPAVPLVEHNRPPAGALRAAGAPVIFEAAFRYRGAAATTRNTPVT